MEKTKKGFTVVEIVVTVSILAIVLAIAIPQYSLYKANIKLRAEAKRLENFLKDQRIYARTQCIDVDIYDAGFFGYAMKSIPSPIKPAAHDIWNETWIGTACAATAPNRSLIFQYFPPHNILERSVLALKAKNARAGYLRLYQASDGMSMGLSFNHEKILKFAPSKIIDGAGRTIAYIEIRLYSSTTPRVYSIFINDVGTTLVCQYDPSSPAAGPDE
jgi:prepilin-type N-terminal cleavage/methylation domain-containing protein